MKEEHSWEWERGKRHRSSGSKLSEELRQDKRIVWLDDGRYKKRNLRRNIRRETWKSEKNFNVGVNEGKVSQTG